jgi:hypothetical protein
MLLGTVCGTPGKSYVALVLRLRRIPGVPLWQCEDTPWSLFTAYTGTINNAPMSSGEPKKRAKLCTTCVC